MNRFSLSRVALVLLLAACASPLDTTGGSASLTSAQEEGIVGAVNCECTTFASLRAAGVISRAATNLMAQRDGADGVYGTDDDRPFQSFDEVSAVPQVGPATIQRLLEYATALGFIDDEDPIAGEWDDVAFTTSEAAATLRVANEASTDELTAGAGLRSNVARNIIDARPLADMDALAAVSQVGPVAMAALKAYALSLPPIDPEPGRPDLNTASQAELEQCAYIGPATAAALIDYRERYGAFETYEEARTLSAFGYVSVSDRAVESLRECVAISGGRPYAGALSVGALLASPDLYEGAVVELAQVVMTANLSSGQTTTLALFDFSEWGFSDWSASGVSAAARIPFVVDADPEMYRRASTSYEAQYAWDTRLNVVNVRGVVERVVVEGTGATLRVRARSISAPGRDFIQVDQRWVSPDRVASLSSLWSRENGVVRTTDGFLINRIATELLDVHPAVLWHTAQTGEMVRIGSTTGCTYDCSVSRYTDSGDGLYRQYVDAWRAAGRP